MIISIIEVNIIWWIWVSLGEVDDLNNDEILGDGG
jgi:hypothetical protein